MKTLRKVPCNDVDRETIYVWVDEEGRATHNTTYMMWPVLCMGAKMFFKDNEIKETMDVTDKEYEETLSVYT